MPEPRRPTGNQAALREANRSRIIDAVKHHGALTQVELAGTTGLSPATVSNIVKELSTSGVLHTAPSTRSGRRAQRVTLAHQLGLTVGIHVSTRHMHVALADTRYTVVTEHRMPLARHHRADSELDKAALLIADMIESVDADREEILGVGIAVAAPVDHGTGMIARRGLMRGWDGIPIAESMAQRVGCPTYVDNSSNLAALAELRLGAARGRSDVVVLELSDGIGAGIVTGGRVLAGQHGTAGELGHVVVDPHGPVCRCGNRGCLEAVAGIDAVLDVVNSGRSRAVNFTDLVVAALTGDDESIRAIADAGRAVGRAVAGLANVLDPQRVVVGGEFARAGELLVGPIRHAFEAGLLRDVGALPELVQTELGGRAPVLGALALAIDALDIQDLVIHDE
ncbi:transcriptional regulator [Luteimicrobium album]|uniref:Transcriptional regulator n=1 Tax=Luteimicrobium album TaxID=1054550 RepID=A0ABQ6HW13_9MICO|nr:ROK family transcriptional regulator [Luteimicrobium album]GMA22572.1 transcriptional regulator [Luteimicrobium album]